MSNLLLEPTGYHGNGQYTPYFYGAESVLTDGDPRHGIPDDHVPFMTRGLCGLSARVSSKRKRVLGLSLIHI